MDKIIVLEHDKQHKDLIIEWTPQRIKACFNYGNGEIRDLHEYIRNNREYATFDIVNDCKNLAEVMTELTGKKWHTNASSVLVKNNLKRESKKGGNRK